MYAVPEYQEMVQHNLTQVLKECAFPEHFSMALDKLILQFGV